MILLTHICLLKFIYGVHRRHSMSKSGFWSKVNHSVGFILYSFIGAYFIWSLVNIIGDFNDELNLGGQILNILALFVEIFGFIFALYFAIQLIDGVLRVGEVPYDLSKITGDTTVSAIVPIHNVQPDVLEETIQGFKQQTYTNFDLWVADDSPNEELRIACKNVCEKNDVKYYYEDNKNFKSGMLNLVIPKTKGSLIAFFDVDHIPTPDILEKFVAIMEQYPEFSFIQAKFCFRNVKNLLHVWEAMGLMQAFCSENARRKINTVLYNGTTAIFRREDCYPIPEGKMTEDYDLSIRLIFEGKQGYFLDEIGSMSLVPETMPHQISQSFRWFRGQSGAMFDYAFKLIKLVLQRKIKLIQAIDIYFSSFLVIGATSFYVLGALYAITYLTRTALVRAWNLGHIWLIVITLLTGIIYLATLSATTIYSMNSATFPLKYWHIPFFLSFGSMVSPFYMIPAFKGLIGRNKLIPGKTKWNKKIPIYRIATIYSLVGLFFLYLMVDSVFQQICYYHDLGFCYYADPYRNFLFLLFALVGFSLAFCLPFIFMTQKMFVPKVYEDKHIYH